MVLPLVDRFARGKIVADRMSKFLTGTYYTACVPPRYATSPPRLCAHDICLSVCTKHFRVPRHGVKSNHGFQPAPPSNRRRRSFIRL